VSRRTSRRFVKLGAVGAVGLAGLALAILTLTSEDDRPADPTRRGPQRYVRISHARIEDRAAGLTLVVRGETNLVAGTRFDVAVLAKQEELLRLAATSDGGAFAVDASAAGAVVEGTYEASVTFRLNDQSEAVRLALDYQPDALTDRRPLTLPLRLARTIDAKDQLRDLFDAVNKQPRDPATIEALDRRAQELADRLWIGQEKTALLRLRLALEESRRPDLRRNEFDRLLIEAHVLAGL
jgi:hypothetical protein